MKKIGALESRKAALQASAKSINRQIDLQKVQLKDDCEAVELSLKEQIMRLNEHAEVIKKQNSELYREMDNLVQAGEYAREQLHRNEIIMRLKERNYEELSRSMRMIEQSRSLEAQREHAYRNAAP